MTSSDLQQGDIVWIINDGNLDSNDPKYSRSYLILSKIKDDQYIICFITSRIRENRIRIERRDLSWGFIDYSPSFVALEPYTLAYQSTWKKTATLQENKIKEILKEYLRFSKHEILYQPRVNLLLSPVFERGKRKS